MRRAPAENSQTYHTREFAALAGVTVRTLRYYDHIGLLTPARSRSGYRIYTRRDLQALQEIVILKTLGFPLSAITALRRGTPAEIALAIRAQRRALEDKARLLNRANRALMELEQTLQDSVNPHAVMFDRIKEILDMEHDNDDWLAAYDTLSRIWQMRITGFRREALIEFGQQWETLAREVQRVLGDDPRGPGAQQLAARFRGLLFRLYGDHVPLSTVVTAGRNIEKWSPSFGRWPGWRFLTDALSAHQETV